TSSSARVSASRTAVVWASATLAAAASARGSSRTHGRGKYRAKVRRTSGSAFRAPGPTSSSLSNWNRINMKSTSRTLTTDELEAFGRELDALGREVTADLGQRDVDHIRAIIRIARQTEAGGRLLLHFGLGPVSFAAGVAALSTSKILENMEI